MTLPWGFQVEQLYELELYEDDFITPGKWELDDINFVPSKEEEQDHPPHLGLVYISEKIPEHEWNDEFEEF